MKKIFVLALLSITLVSCTKTAAPTDDATTQTPTEQTTDTPAVTE